MPSPAALSKAQCTYLYNTLVSEKTSGRLTGLADVRKSLDLWTKEVPAAGVQITDVGFKPYASNRRIMVVEFTIRVAVQSVANGDTPPNGDDAVAKLWDLIEDDNGNGFSPVLLDPTYRTLGQNCMDFEIIGIKPFTILDDGNTADVWAEAYITCQSQAIVGIA